MNGKDKKIAKSLKKILGFKPKNISYYQTAFIHKSATFINHKGAVINNERLEFLGDAILDAVVSDFLYKKYPDFDEGLLTKTRAKIVNTKQLAFYNKRMGINKFLQVHTSGQLNNKHLYADSLEALIGAIYLDKGYSRTYKFIKNILIKKFTDLDQLINTEINHKSRIIELSQKQNFKIEFNTTVCKDDEHTFVAKILINNKEIAKGYGSTKKEAEQNASFFAMKKINPDYNNGKEKNTVKN